MFDLFFFLCSIFNISHTIWECKYHIVFAPKFRRKVAYGQIRQDIANILSTLCKRKGVEIIEAEVCPDHIHMLVRIPPSMSVSSFVGYLKGYVLMLNEPEIKDSTTEERRAYIKERFPCIADCDMCGLF